MQRELDRLRRAEIGRLRIFFHKYLGARRRRTPRANADLEVPDDASHRDLSDAIIGSVVALGILPSACSKQNFHAPAEGTLSSSSPSTSAASTSPRKVFFATHLSPKPPSRSRQSDVDWDRTGRNEQKARLEELLRQSADEKTMLYDELRGLQERDGVLQQVTWQFQPWGCDVGVGWAGGRFEQSQNTGARA